LVTRRVAKESRCAAAGSTATFADEAAGKTRDTFGHAKRKVGEAAEHIGKTVKK
jgi:hypothetical protein